MQSRDKKQNARPAIARRLRAIGKNTAQASAASDATPSENVLDSHGAESRAPSRSTGDYRSKCGPDCGIHLRKKWTTHRWRSRTGRRCCDSLGVESQGTETHLSG